MIRTEVIRKRLEKLAEYIDVLEGLQKYTLDEFIDNPQYYGSAERFLHLSIEAFNDMAGHVISEMELGMIDQYRDIPEQFEKQGWIDKELKEKWLNMIGFRNILVHDYLDIDRTIVYRVLQDHMDDLKELRQVFARFL
jgi:uncharacterized protein YutE (UPF0331/DUF86 family)